MNTDGGKEMSVTMKENNSIVNFNNENENGGWEDELHEKSIRYSDFEPENDDEDPNCYVPAGEAWENRKKKLIRYFSDPSNRPWEKVQERFMRIKDRYFKGKVEEIAELTFFTEVLAVTPAQKLLYLVHLIYTQLDVRVCEHVPLVVWKNCLQNALVVLDILEMYPNIVFDTSVSARDTEKGANYKGRISINFWSMVGIYSAIDTQFHVSVMSVKPQTRLYYNMLKCEHLLFVFGQNCLEYFKKESDYKAAAKVAFGLLNLVYYKSRPAYTEMQNEHPKCVEDGRVEEKWPIHPIVVIPECVPRRATFSENSTILMDSLLPFVKKHGNEQTKTHAIIFEIHHHAIMDNFSQAEDLLLKSKMQAKVEIMDVATKRHFYRAVAQVGLCAFRAGSIKKAYKYLSQLYAHGVEQALGQAVPRRSHKPLTPTEEIYERRKLTPFYLRISSKLLEFVYKVCDVLLKDTADMIVIIRGNKWKKLESILLGKLQEAISDTTSAPSIIDSDRYAMITHLGLELKQSVSTAKDEQVFGNQFAYGRNKLASVPPDGDAQPPPEESGEESDEDMMV